MKLIPGKLLQIMREREGSLVSGSVVYVVSNLLNAAIPFFLLPVLTRFLSPTEYGLVGIFQLALAFLGAFTGLSVHGAANRKVFDKDSGRVLPEYIFSCVVTVIVSTCFVLLVVYLCRGILRDWTGLDPDWLLLAVLASALTYICNLRLGQWQVRNQALPYGFFQVSRSLLNAGLSLCFVISLGLGLEGRIGGQMLALLVFGLAGIWLLYKDRLLKLALRKEYFREILAFGLPLIPHVCGLVLLTMMDRVVVKQYLGLEQTGVFMVAVQIAMGLSLIADAVNKAYVPWLYQQLAEGGMHEKIRIVRMTYVYFGLAIFLAAIVMLVAPFFVPWLAGDDYREAGLVLRWLAFGQAFNAMYLMVTNYIFYSRRTVNLSLVTVCVGVVHILLAIVLVQKYGLSGVAMAYVVSMAARFVLTWYLAQRQHPMPWFSALTMQR